MLARRRTIAIASALLPAALSMAGCGGLPRALRNQIASERTSLQQAQKQLQQASDTVKQDLAYKSDLFKNTPVSTEWPSRLASAHAELDRASNDLRDIDKVKPQRAQQLVDEAHRLRQSATTDAQSVAADADSWIDFQRNQPHYLAAMQREYDRIRAVDLTPVSQVVQKAEQDWPAKKSTLDDRFAALKQSQTDADMQWQSTATSRADSMAGKATGAEVATLIEANDALTRDENNLTHGAGDLRAACGQLYDSWDKILADLDVAHHGNDLVYSEKLNIVRTHYTDVTAKQTETSSENKWVDVSPSAYHAVDNDLGMVIAHKNFGQFDSEAQTTPEPPGYAYIAPPSVGSNQYGYWSHEGGNSVWTWLPQYLILRELFWGHRYQPIYINEYNGYQTAFRAGHTWYGQTTPNAAPKYGSHGTFTQQRYADSRFVQHGGYNGSSFSSNRSAESGLSRPESGFLPRSSPSDENPGVGKRFGGSGGGQRFGSGSRGFGSGSAGKRFGSPHSAPRSFGHHR